MPNTKSAEQRMRNNARKRLRNQAVKSRLKTLEKNFIGLCSQEDQAKSAGQAYRSVCSALDKAAKKNIIARNRANDKKSRLAARAPTL